MCFLAGTHWSIRSHGAEGPPWTRMMRMAAFGCLVIEVGRCRGGQYYRAPQPPFARAGYLSPVTNKSRKG